MGTHGWLVADTIRSDRKDIFCLTGPDQRHVGTIISGSRTYLGRFERDVTLIRKSPDMQSVLADLLEGVECNSLDEHSLRTLSLRARNILEDIAAPYREG